MQVGEQVVCVDDQFPRPLAKYYINLPKKADTYTVRAVYIGRGVMHPAAETTHGEIGLLLKELVNGMDPRHKHKQELGFNSVRFRALLDPAAHDEEELVRVRAAPKVEPLKEIPLPYSPRETISRTEAFTIPKSHPAKDLVPCIMHGFSYLPSCSLQES